MKFDHERETELTSVPAQLETDIALKEWAILCAALASGKQTILVRKGGIAEGPDGFQPEHPTFWLFPTNFHQAETALNNDGKAFLSHPDIKSNLTPPPAEQIVLKHVGQIEQIIRLEQESLLPFLNTFQLLSPETLSNRFHYKEPGLWVMVVRIYQAQDPIVIPDSPHFTGCRSWVDLPRPYSSPQAEPVLSEEEFQDQVRKLNSVLSENAIG
ncbi:DUF1802 family protein [Polystyrenella longa]|nr:DUF1802 family protein [Polystyrenella longa]